MREAQRVSKSALRQWARQRVQEVLDGYNCVRLVGTSTNGFLDELSSVCAHLN